MAFYSSCIWLCVQHTEGVLDECLIGPLVFSYCKREKITIIASPAFICIDQISHVIKFYLSPEGLEVMTQIKYSLAAMESSTLFTSLVKLPSTCLLCVSDLSTYTGT